MSPAKVIRLRDSGGSEEHPSASAGSGLPASGPDVPGWERKAAGALAFLRRRLTGDFDVDEYGYDQDYYDHVICPALNWVYDSYWRVETFGLENIPDDGAALLVSNHSGTVAIDLPMVTVAVREHHPKHRMVRALGANFVFALPVLAVIARRMGATLACNEDADDLLSKGHLVAVFPEGVKGVGKGWNERYKLQRFGRGGFVRTAIKNGVPIIPTAIIGAEEALPMIGRFNGLGKMIGVPFIPVLPTPVPLPSKWMIQFGEPIPTDHLDKDALDDPMLLSELSDQIRETIQQQVYDLLRTRKSIFF